MAMITGQLSPSDPRKQEYATLADEGGITATLWVGIESVIVQVDKTGSVNVVYDDGRGGARKEIFHSFFRDLWLTNDFCYTDDDGSMVVE
jgi:hypothetical protein